MATLTDEETSSDGTDSVAQSDAVASKSAAAAPVRVSGSLARQDSSESSDSSAVVERVVNDDGSSSSSSSPRVGGRQPATRPVPTPLVSQALDSEGESSAVPSRQTTPKTASSPSRGRVKEAVANHERESEERKRRQEEEEEDRQRRKARAAEEEQRRQQEAQELEAEREKERQRRIKQEEEEKDLQRRRKAQEEEEREREEKRLRAEEEEREKQRMQEEEEKKAQERKRKEAEAAEEARKQIQLQEEEEEKERLAVIAREEQRKMEEERRERNRRREEEEERQRKEQEAADRRWRLEAEKQEAQRLEAVLWESLRPEEKQRLRTMLQGIALFRQQLEQSRQDEQDLNTQIANKDVACKDLRRRAENADSEARMAREREFRQGDEIARWDQKRIHCEEASEGVDMLRTSHAALQADAGRLKKQVEPMRVQLLSLHERLAASEEGGRVNATRLAALKAHCQQAVAEVKSQQVAEIATLRAKHMEELTKLEVEWTAQVSELRSLHVEDASGLKRNVEETCRRCERVLLERDDAREQMIARQREGMRLQQQCADARQEVLELSAQVRSSLPPQSPATPQRQGLARSFSATALETTALHGSLQDARYMDCEMFDLRQRCKDLEQKCARMHGLLERGQTACERWRRRGLGASTSTLLIGLDDAGGRPAPFELGPAEPSEPVSAPRTPEMTRQGRRDAPLPPAELSSSRPGSP